MLLVLSQAHLKKLFQGIHSVNFSDDQKSIIAMCSVAGEVGVDLHYLALTCHSACRHKCASAVLVVAAFRKLARACLWLMSILLFCC